MKTENKISKLAIVSALCAMIAVPSYAASSVRALGGSDTYNGTTSAANAKSGSTGSAGTMRAGSMRVNNATSGTNTRVTSSRTATSPRLSIGKYLGGSSVISGGSSSKPMNPGQSGVGGPSGDVSELSNRVAALEQFTGYSENGDQIKDTVADLVIDVAALQADKAEASELENKLDTQKSANQILEGQYKVTGTLYVPTPEYPEYLLPEK